MGETGNDTAGDTSRGTRRSRRSRRSRGGAGRVRARGHSRSVAWAVALTLALAAPLAAIPSTAEARPRVTPPTSPAPGEESVLRPGQLVSLGAGAKDVRVDESPYGSHVAVTWTVRSQGRDVLWARVKRGSSWGAKVRLSGRRAHVVRHDMDLDSDGSLLVGWAQRRGKKHSVVVRRVVGSQARSTTTFPGRARGGPRVGAGPWRDVVAWTTTHRKTLRPTTSVDVGAGFQRAKVVGPRVRTPVVADSLAVDADGRHVHLTYLTRARAAEDPDRPERKVLAATATWSVMTPRKDRWSTWQHLGPLQPLASPITPMIAVDRHDVAALVFHDNAGPISQGARPYPVVRLFDPRGAGSPLARLDDTRSLEVTGDDGRPRVVSGVRHRAGHVLAAFDTTTGLSPLLKQVTSPEARGEFDPRDWPTFSACTPARHWFFVWSGDWAEIHCLDNDSGDHVAVLNDIFDPTRPVSRVDPDPALAGSSVAGAVPDPLVPVLTLTERLRKASAAPVWLLDHTAGGTDPRPARLRMVRARKASLAGKARVGRTLVARPGTWRPAPARVTYRWFAGPRRIKGVNGPELTLTKAMTGTRIRVTMTLTRSGHARTTVTPRRTPPVRR